MQKSIYAGISDHGIRWDLQETPTRTFSIDDDDVLDDIFQAMSSLKEHMLRI